MSWQQTEFILKGVYLGLLVFIGIQLPQVNWWQDVGLVALCTLGGLALFLGVAAVRKLREGYRVKGRLPAFILFLLLENPVLVYAGVILGLSASAILVRTADEEHWKLLATVGGGAVLGYVFWVLIHVRKTQTRFWLGLALAVGLVAGAIWVLQDPEVLRGRRAQVGTLLLLGIPLFYLLTFAGVVEESEVEIAAICAALGVALWILMEQLASSSASGNFGTISLGVPLVLYFFYTKRVLPGLRVLKHVLRGISFANVGRYRPALVSLNRALQLDPQNRLAREQLWSVHRQMDLTQVVNDPETLALVNFELCLERAAWLLLQPRPSADYLAEAHRLLDLVSSQRPAMRPRCDYWRAVALCHQHQYDEAADRLEDVLASHSSAPDNPHRRTILVEAWDLALNLHPEMIRRVGTREIAEPGRRMEAIAAVERRLASKADDETALRLKKMLYDDLAEGEYLHAAGQEKPAEHFDYEYCRALGEKLIAAESGWERGEEYLRIAAHGLPALGPKLFFDIAKAHERAGDFKGVWLNYERAQRAGKAAGPKNLSADDRHLYFAVVKALADDAMQHNEVDNAIENYHLYTEYERAGLETYRNLAELYRRRAEQTKSRDDVWAGLRCTEQGLTYDSADKDLLQRKDDFYASLRPEEVKPRWDDVRKWFDVAYCMNKSRLLLDRQGDNLELLDWADHLAQLAQAAWPGSLAARVLRARVLRRRGEIEQAVALLEEVRQNKPEKFPTNEEEEGWFLSCRLLGDLYLHEKPELAIECFQEYRKNPKSGADTTFKLGVAYENLGDIPRAVKCYQAVVAYETHPRAPEAHEALQRLQAAT